MTQSTRTNGGSIWLVAALALTAMACDDGSSSAEREGDGDGGQLLTDGGAGGDDGGMVEPDAAPPEPDAAPGPAVVGRMYDDENRSDVSAFLGAYEAEEDAPIEGAAVQLLGTDRDTETDAEGVFRFGGVEDGQYVVAPEFPEATCARKNCAPHFLAALAAGEATILTIGDSIPVIGDEPLFPARVARLLEDVADVTDNNVAVAGSTSTQWLPGAMHYEQRVVPNVADADLMIISIGGNDILQYAGNPALLGDIPAAIQGARELVIEIAMNVRTTIEAARELNPELDVAFCLYVNYAQAQTNQFWSLAKGLLGEEEITGILELARQVLPADEGVVLVDLFEAAQDVDVDSILLMGDALHFNDVGQTLYAETIFETLGGVLVGINPLPHGRTPIGMEPGYSFLP